MIRLVAIHLIQYYILAHNNQSISNHCTSNSMDVLLEEGNVPTESANKEKNFIFDYWVLQQTMPFRNERDEVVINPPRKLKQV